MPFRCVIVTPEQQVLDESLTQAILPAHDGLIGVLTDRAPLLVKLGQGPLRVDLAGGQSQHFYVEGGVAQMKDNRLTILTNEATPSSEIDAEAVARRITDQHSFDDREKQLARARAKQQLAGQR